MSDNENSKNAVPLIWSLAHIRVVLIFLVACAVLGAWRLACNSTFIDDPQPEIPARADDLADRLDPNTADWQALAAIPSLGEKKAHLITAYRDRWIITHPKTPAFARPQDLRNVKGIGPATVANLVPYLVFPSDKNSP